MPDDDYNDETNPDRGKRPVHRTPNPAPFLGHDRRLHKGAASLDRQEEHPSPEAAASQVKVLDHQFALLLRIVTVAVGVHPDV